MPSLSDWVEIANAQADELARRMRGPRQAVMFEGHGDGVAAVMEAVTAEADVLRARIDSAVRTFASSRQWPTLEGASDAAAERFVFGPTMLLMHRIGFAIRVLGRWVDSGGEFSPPKDAPEPPSCYDDEQFITWMFIDLWNAGGAAYLRDHIEDAGRRLTFVAVPIEDHRAIQQAVVEGQAAIDNASPGTSEQPESTRGE